MACKRVIWLAAYPVSFHSPAWMTWYPFNSWMDWEQPFVQIKIRLKFMSLKVSGCLQHSATTPFCTIQIVLFQDKLACCNVLSSSGSVHGISLVDGFVRDQIHFSPLEAHFWHALHALWHDIYLHPPPPMVYEKIVIIPYWVVFIVYNRYSLHSYQIN